MFLKQFTFCTFCTKLIQSRVKIVKKVKPKQNNYFFHTLMYTQPYLQKYKGISTRHTCPECGQKQSFTLYLDGNTNEPIHITVGKCNRESKCGYHYTPKQYFMDNPSTRTDVACHVSKQPPQPITPTQPSGTIPFSFIEKSASYRSNFVRFLCEILTNEQIHLIGENYALGATKSKEVIFWQIDMNGKVRTGKIMQYNPETGRRLKHESGAIDWVHSKLKKSGTLPEDYNLQQCFFGEHLLTIYPEATVCIVESEKSALISAAIFPNFIWLASGGIQGLAVNKCKVLKDRTVILYPDLNVFEKWSEKAQMLNSLFPSPLGEGPEVRCSVSTLLEDIATPEAKANGLDVADFMINQLTSKPKIKPIEVAPVQNRFTPELKQIIETNPALLLLINKLELIEY